MDDGKTRKLIPSLFKKLPKQYYQYALQWCSFANWTVEEAANLLTGCVTHREMFLKGQGHKELDAEVLENEYKVRAALGEMLKIVKSRKFFGKTYIDSSNIIDWAVQNDIVVPVDLLKVHGEIRRQWGQSSYTTPCLQAVE